MVLKLQKSACGLSLRDGSLSIAFAFMVGMCSGLVGYIAYLKGRLYDYLLTEEECFFLYLEITILVVLLIFNMLLVIGVVLENTGILLAWVIAHALYAFFLISKFTTSFYDAVVTVELLYCVGVLVFYLSILWLVLYSIMVVYSYRALIKAAENCPCVEEEKQRLRDFDNDEDPKSGGGGKRMPLDNRMYGEQPESPVQPLKKSTLRRPSPPPPPETPPPHQPSPPTTPPRQPSQMSQHLPSQTMPPPRQGPSIQSQPLPMRRQPSNQSNQSQSQPPPRQGPSMQQQQQQQQQQPQRLTPIQSESPPPPPTLQEQHGSSLQTHASLQPSQQVQMTWRKQTIAPSTPSLPSPPEAASSRNASMTYAAGPSGIQSRQFLSMSGQGTAPHSSNVSRMGMVVPITYKRDWSPDGSIQLLTAAPARSPAYNQPSPWKMAILNPNPGAPSPVVRARTNPMAPAKPWRQAPVAKKPSPLVSVTSEGSGATGADPAAQRPTTKASDEDEHSPPSRASIQQGLPRKSRLARDASRLSARSSELRSVVPIRASSKPSKHRTTTRGPSRCSKRPTKSKGLRATASGRSSGGSEPQKYVTPAQSLTHPDRRTPSDTQRNLVRKTSITGEKIAAQSPKTHTQTSAVTSGPTVTQPRPGFAARPEPHPYGSDGGLGRLWRTRTERAKLRRSPIRK